MSKDQRTPLQGRIQSRAFRTWGIYLLALMAWVTIVITCAILGYLVCSAFTWYAWDPLYQFLNGIRDYIVFVCMLVILLGWVAISYSFIARPMRLVDTLAAAAEQLAQAVTLRDTITAALSADFPAILLDLIPRS